MNKKIKKGKVNILAVIPARGGSKGVPRKNIRPLAGKPLLYYMLKAALGSKTITRVVVSSEDDEILEVARKYGGEAVPLRRPKELAEDKSASWPVLQHAVQEIEGREDIVFDYFVMLQPTNPFVSAEDIDLALKKLIETGADTVVSVCEIKDTHPIKIKKIVDDRLVQYVDGMEENVFRRQDLPPVYKRNGGIYANTRKMIVEKCSPYGNKGVCRPYVMSEEQSVDINTMLDFEFADMLMRKLKKGKNEKKN